MKLQRLENDFYTFTFHIVDQCFCKCSYCYQTDKPGSAAYSEAFWKRTAHADEARDYSFLKKDTPPKVMSLETAEKFIDRIISDYDEFYEFVTSKDRSHPVMFDKICLDFFGGDALQEIDRLDEIITLCEKRLNALPKGHKIKGWSFSVSSNGLPLLDEHTRKVLEKWRWKINLGISIDGCKELHDKNRWVFADKDGGKKRGSFDYIMENWEWYKKTFCYNSWNTKWTLGNSGYKYIMESVRFMHEKLGISHLFFNRAMEDCIVDTKNETKELLSQFEQLIEYELEHQNCLYISPFDYNDFLLRVAGKEALRELEPHCTRCGFGSMMSCDVDGNIYPCMRLFPNFGQDVSEYITGSVNTKLIDNMERLTEINKRAELLSLEIPEKNIYGRDCTKCPILSSCPYCIAGIVADGNANKKRRLTSSVCNFTMVSWSSAVLYWARLDDSEHPVSKEVFDTACGLLDEVKRWAYS